MISIQDFQSIDFNDDYIHNCSNQLRSIKGKINIMLENIKGFKKQIEEIRNNYINFEMCYSSLLLTVESFIYWLDNIRKIKIGQDEKVKTNLDYYNKIKEKYMNCDKCISIIIEKDYVSKIRELNQKLNRIINDMCELKFCPPKIGSFNVSNIKINLSNMKINDSDVSQSYFDHSSTIDKSTNDFEEFFNYVDNYNNENNDEEIRCNICKVYKAEKICSHCDRYYCGGCVGFIEKYEMLSDHIFTDVSENLFLHDKSRINFLETVILLFKHYIIKCNSLLANKSFSEYPSIEKINDFKSQINYLEDINKLCPDNNNEEDNINNEDNIRINRRIITALENMFRGNNKLNIASEYNTIDCDFLNERYKLKDEEEFKNIKNELFYFITVVSREKLKLNPNITEIITDKISQTLFIKKNKIFVLLNDKIDNFIKSQNFYDLHYKHFEIKNPIFNKLHEVKLLLDKFLCYECHIPKKFFDFRGNTVNPNSSNNLIRGTEKYDPPYGWIGIGLNVLDEYDNGNNDWLMNNTKSSEWAIAYRGISPSNQSNKINQLLKYIITKRDLNNAISTINEKTNDIRNWGKVGKGVYLTPNIRIAEKLTKIISVNNKKYKVLFMARAYIKEIREPENTYFWVLNKENIRIYRILFKEIK